jgi:hypothetical protein
VRNAGVKKNALCRSGLASINVSANTDIAIAVNRGFASHVDTLLLNSANLESEV